MGSGNPSSTASADSVVLRCAGEFTKTSRSLTSTRNSGDAVFFSGSLEITQSSSKGFLQTQIQLRAQPSSRGSLAHNPDTIHNFSNFVPVGADEAIILYTLDRRFYAERKAIYPVDSTHVAR